VDFAGNLARDSLALSFITMGSSNSAFIFIEKGSFGKHPRLSRQSALGNLTSADGQDAVSEKIARALQSGDAASPSQPRL